MFCCAGSWRNDLVYWDLQFWCGCGPFVPRESYNWTENVCNHPSLINFTYCHVAAPYHVLYNCRQQKKACGYVRACALQHEVSCQNVHCMMWSISAAKPWHYLPTCNTVSVTGWCAASLGDWCLMCQESVVISFLRSRQPRNCDFISSKARRVYSSPKHPDHLWGPTSFLFHGYWKIFPWV